MMGFFSSLFSNRLSNSLRVVSPLFNVARPFDPIPWFTGEMTTIVFF
jgi:cytoplasmic iron level regulating protein YaaA (DUF328/UPF0246 family)